MKRIVRKPIKLESEEVIRFECRRCGCVYDTDEHRPTPMIAQQKGEGTYISTCPICRQEVWK